ncbi:hypothetical protein V4762_08955 [Thermodesulfobium sp. 4217-1]|uniref:hypothetical protein n=1 Tax=Thermodesulfobium sp. 4217-1 TaxID=3120013 RepID=UPI0032218235
MISAFLPPITVNNYNVYLPIKGNNYYCSIKNISNYKYSMLDFSNLIIFNSLKSNDENNRFITFINPFIVISKEVDNQIMLEWIEDQDLFGMGETLEEAQTDLLYNIEGVLLMKNFTEEELSKDARILLEKLLANIKETNIVA